MSVRPLPRPAPALRLALLTGLALPACTGKAPAGDSGAAEGVPAIVDPDRGEHYFDVPFPRDELLDDQGFPDLSGFPSTAETVAGPVVDGWARRLELTANGFGNNTAAYLRFEGPLEGLPAETSGLADDPVLMVGMGGGAAPEGELLPLELRFVADPHGDPFYAENTLAVAPALGHPPASGGTYAVVVMTSAGAAPPEGYSLPEGVQAALDAAGVEGSAAVATVFTVQDVSAQLRRLVVDLDERLDAAHFEGVVLKRVVKLEIRQGSTESGEEGTSITSIYEDGSSRTAWAFSVGEDEGNHDVDLGEDWPMVVYEGEIPVLNYSGLEDAPYMSAGFAHLTDTERYSGWIDFAGGELLSEPEVEPMRITVALPKDAEGEAIEDAPVAIYDHGTAGHAWNAHQKTRRSDNGYELSKRFADAGWALIGRDAALYGTRYPLIDEGFTAGNLGFYNIVNTPAFRDNQRQTAIDGHTLRRYLELGLNDVLPTGSVDGSRVRRIGHSMGSVTTNLGAVASPGDYESVYLSGTGGVFIEYFIDTGLIAQFDRSTLESLFTLFGAEAPEEITTEAALGAALGLEEEAWAHIDRLHPVGTLFQWQMDPSDPMAVARDQDAPSVILLAHGDYQVPNPTTWALAGALEDPAVVECTVDGDYDPHYCLHRMELAWDSVTDWLTDELP